MDMTEELSRYKASNPRSANLQKQALRVGGIPSLQEGFVREGRDVSLKQFLRTLSVVMPCIAPSTVTPRSEWATWTMVGRGVT